VESDFEQHWELESDFFVRLRLSNWIIFSFKIPVEMNRLLLKRLLKQIFLAVHHDFH